MAGKSKELVICVKNDGYADSLEGCKLYVSIPDARAAKHGQTRVIDESGEDYLYPQDFFVAVNCRSRCAVECCRQFSGTSDQFMSTAKEELTRLIQGQPEDSSREEMWYPSLVIRYPRQSRQSRRHSIHQ